MSHKLQLCRLHHRSGTCLIRTGLVVTLSALGFLAAGSAVNAQEYLVGAYLFAADGTGTTVTPSATYQYDTNSSDGASALDINGNGKDISFALSGSTTFTFSQSAAPISTFGGVAGDLGLFFDTTNTPYSSSTPRPPDLLVARLTDGTAAFFTPTAGTAINSYFYTPYGSSIPANGATSVTVGSTTFTVTAFTVNDDTSGSFTVSNGSVQATPEPGSVALLAGMGVSAAAFLARRRKRA